MKEQKGIMIPKEILLEELQVLHYVPRMRGTGDNERDYQRLVNAGNVGENGEIPLASVIDFLHENFDLAYEEDAAFSVCSFLFGICDYIKELEIG